MCRNIKTLHNFKPPATEDEIHASAIQFVRKLSGFNKPSKTNEAAFLNGAPYSTNRSIFSAEGFLLASYNPLGYSNVFTYNNNGQILIRQTKHPNALPASWHCSGQHRSVVSRVYCASARPVRFRSGMRLPQLCHVKVLKTS